MLIQNVWLDDSILQLYIIAFERKIKCSLKIIKVIYSYEIYNKKQNKINLHPKKQILI